MLRASLACYCPADISCIGCVLLKHIQYHGMPSWGNFATKNSGYRWYITHRLLLDLNSKDRDMLEVINNIIYCNNLKFQQYLRSRNVPIKRHVTRHVIKSNDSIALVREVAFEVRLLSPSDFNSTIVVKMSSYWSMIEDIGYCRHESCRDQRVSDHFCRRFLLRLLALSTVGALVRLWWSSRYIGPCLDSNEHPWT